MRGRFGDASGVRCSADRVMRHQGGQKTRLAYGEHRAGCGHSAVPRHRRHERTGGASSCPTIPLKDGGAGRLARREATGTKKAVASQGVQGEPRPLARLLLGKKVATKWAAVKQKCRIVSGLGAPSPVESRGVSARPVGSSRGNAEPAGEHSCRVMAWHVRSSLALSIRVSSCHGKCRRVQARRVPAGRVTSSHVRACGVRCGHVPSRQPHPTPAAQSRQACRVGWCAVLSGHVTASRVRASPIARRPSIPHGHPGHVGSRHTAHPPCVPESRVCAWRWRTAAGSCGVVGGSPAIASASSVVGQGG